MSLVTARPLVLPLLLCALSCAGAGGQGSSASKSVSSNGSEVASPFDATGSALPFFHSKRFDVDLPLPDGKAWKVNDHTGPSLIATHAASQSQVTLQVFIQDELVNRQRCEKAALAGHMIGTSTLVAVEDANIITHGDFDTHLVVGLEPAAPGQPLVGHVIAVGGFLHKCYAFDFRSQVASEAEADTLSERLAFGRARIFKGLRFKDFATPPTTTPAGR